MVLVTIRPENEVIEVRKARTVLGLLNRLGLKPNRALVIRRGRLLTSDRVLEHGDEIEIRNVVSSGQGMKCKRCRETAAVALPSHHTGFCEKCFVRFFVRQVETALRRRKMLRPGGRVLVALSGGKDSLALMWVLNHLGYEAHGLHVDLGISGSSEIARERVEAFCQEHSLPLEVFETASMGLPIPLVKAVVQRPVCSACGKVKRYVFNKRAIEGGYEALATGHNLDDETARLFANTLRWDAAYLSDQGPVLEPRDGFAKRIKPLYRLSEFETAAFSFIQGIEYSVEPCPYSRGASFTGHKSLLADLEDARPGAKFQFYEDFLKKGRQAFEALERDTGAPLAPCIECGYPTSAGTCGVCRLKDQVARAGEVLE